MQGVPAVGRADLQGSTQVDNHDESMVSGHFTPWLHEEPMVRPNIGRHVFARMDLAEGANCRDGGTNPGVMEVIAETVHTTVEASSNHDGRGHRCMETVQDTELILRGFRRKSLCPLLQLLCKQQEWKSVLTPGQRVALIRGLYWTKTLFLTP